MAYTITDINNKKPDYSSLTATSFGRIEQQGNAKIKHVNCLCECGNIITTRMSSILNGHTASCGCKRKDQIKKGTGGKKMSIKHSQYHYNIAAIYQGMIRRCYDFKHPAYKNYGAKGVIVCEEWRTNYQSFLDWCLSNGWEKGLHLDKDKNGNGKLYSPNTCAFITPRKNLLARSITRSILYKGIMTPVSEVAEMVKIPYASLYANCVQSKVSIEDYIIKYKPKKSHGCTLAKGN